MTTPTAVNRLFIDPATNEPVEVPYGFRLVRIANHPETGDMIVLPRDQLTAQLTVHIPNTNLCGASDCNEVITTDVKLRSRLVMVPEPMEQVVAA